MMSIYERKQIETKEPFSRLLIPNCKLDPDMDQSYDFMGNDMNFPQSPLNMVSNPF